MRIFSSLAFAAVVPFSVHACSEEDAKTPALHAATDAGAVKNDASGDAGTGAPDAAPAPEQVRCTDAELDAPCSASGGDCTQDAQVQIVFPTGESPAQYAPHCVKVRSGADVVFAGDFTKHPLRPKGGDSPSPIPSVDANPAVGPSGKPELVVHVSTPNRTYGFECGIHGGGMFGAVRVAP